MSDRYEKNIKAMKDIVDGNYKGKIQSGYDPAEIQREVGDIWTDSDGNELEQRKGYKMKISKVRVGIFPHKCKDCGTNCDTKKIDKETYMRMERCMYCQIDFEAKLRTYPIKYWAWIKLQALLRWEAMDKEVLEYLEEKESINNKNRYDKKVANALANEEIDLNNIKMRN